VSRYVYALLAERPRGEAGEGLQSEPLAFLRVEGLLAAVGELPAAPPVTRATRLAHDAVVRRLASSVDAILPVQFGTVVDDEAALAEAITPRMARLHAALARVAGREQMTLRLFGEATGTDHAPSIDPALGPGARYLDARRRMHGAAAVPELGPLRQALAPMVRAEHVERHARPPLVASVYHLIDRGRADAYRTAIAETAVALAPMRVTASGPWPPYAFARESLS
jgi:hypothetical protein